MYISSSSFSYRLLSGLLFCLLIACRNEADSNNQYVNKWIGTGLEGRVAPVASVPFGICLLYTSDAADEL